MKANFHQYMDEALHEAEAAGRAGEVPIGAVIVHQNTIIARAQNRTRRNLDPSAHAEILAIRQACQHLRNFRLLECDLYVSLEPCAMCAGAISEARIRRLYFAAEDQKSGGTIHGARVFEHSQAHHKPEIYPGLSEEKAAHMLQQFFAKRRK